MDQRWHVSCIPNKTRMDKRILPVLGFFHNDRHLIFRNMETAEPIWKTTLCWAWTTARTHPGSYERNMTDFRETTRRLPALQREEGRVSARPFNETLRADFDWHSHAWRSHFLQAGRSHFPKIVAGSLRFEEVPPAEAGWVLPEYQTRMLGDATTRWLHHSILGFDTSVQPEGKSQDNCEDQRHWPLAVDILSFSLMSGGVRSIYRWLSALGAQR